MAKHFIIVMEFKKAKQVMEDGKVVLKKLLAKFRGAQEPSAD